MLDKITPQEWITVVIAAFSLGGIYFQLKAINRCVKVLLSRVYTMDRTLIALKQAHEDRTNRKLCVAAGVPVSVEEDEE